MGLNDYYLIIENFSQEDLDIVKKFYWEKINPVHEAMTTPQINSTRRITYFQINSDTLTDEIDFLQKKYPMLGNHCLVNSLWPTGATKIHIDGEPPNINTLSSKTRMCAINFPIMGCDPNSPTIFYGMFDEYESEYLSDNKVCRIKDHETPIEKARVAIHDKPVLINTKTWHDVVNNTKEQRLTFSWTCKFDYDFHKVRSMLLESTL